MAGCSKVGCKAPPVKNRRQRPRRSVSHMHHPIADPHPNPNTGATACCEQFTCRIPMAWCEERSAPGRKAWTATARNRCQMPPRGVLASLRIAALDLVQTQVGVVCGPFGEPAHLLMPFSGQIWTRSGIVTSAGLQRLAIDPLAQITPPVPHAWAVGSMQRVRCAR